MGCTSSNQAGEDDEQKKKVAAQRRRLSVAPQHVGDITITKEEHATAKEESELSIKDDSKQGFRVAALSQKGFVPYNKNKQNQDRDLVYTFESNEDIRIFAVMDGHGEFGHQVSQFVKENFPVHLKSQIEKGSLQKSPKEAITTAVDDLVQQLHDEGQINVGFSGTTAIICVNIKQILYVANIGDSRCILCRKDGNEFKVVPLSEDHKPENPGEKERILARGGRVEPLQGLPGEDCGPHRVWLMEMDVPGLAMSRSIGDEVSKSVGVIHTPAISEHKLDEDDEFIVLATDGVWEFLSNQDTCKIVRNHVLQGNMQTAVESLVAASTESWRRNEDVVDDITTVIVKFDDFSKM